MEYRLYSFVNYYLSQIQAGIQTGHSAVDLVRFAQLLKDSGQRIEDAKIVEEWADKHKTFIVLNGGNSKMLDDVRRIVQESGFLYNVFYEDQESLEGLMTCVSVVLPESVFNAQKAISTLSNSISGDPEYYRSTVVDKYNENVYYSFTPIAKEYELIQLLRSSKLF